MEQVKILPCCLFCKNPGNIGDPGGVFIRGKYICPKCESRIIKSEVTDNKYKHLVETIKSIWF